MRPGQKTEFARRLRAAQTDAECRLWICLRNRQLLGCKFRRQFAMGPYVVDFACPSHRLIVELDGGQHSVPSEYDEQRTQFLVRLGYRVLRFWNNEVLAQQEAALAVIATMLAERCPHPNPLPQAGEGAEGEST